VGLALAGLLDAMTFESCGEPWVVRTGSAKIDMHIREGNTPRGAVGKKSASA
jgi:hypothetical protein